DAFPRPLKIPTKTWTGPALIAGVALAAAGLLGTATLQYAAPPGWDTTFGANGFAVRQFRDFVAAPPRLAPGAFAAAFRILFLAMGWGGYSAAVAAGWNGAVRAGSTTRIAVGLAALAAALAAVYP